MHFLKLPIQVSHLSDAICVILLRFLNVHIMMLPSEVFVLFLKLVPVLPPHYRSVTVTLIFEIHEPQHAVYHQFGDYVERYD